MLGVGRFAALRDAQGAAFAAITSERKPEPENDPKPLEFSWHELTTDDWKAAEAFYSAPFGWKKSSKPGAKWSGLEPRHQRAIVGKSGIQFGEFEAKGLRMLRVPAVADQRLPGQIVPPVGHGAHCAVFEVGGRGIASPKGGALLSRISWRGHGRRRARIAGFACCRDLSFARASIDV
jgi:hypothetical protein